MGQVGAVVEDRVEVEVGRRLAEQLAELGARVPGALGVLLDDAVGVVAGHARLDQGGQGPLAEEGAVGELEVLAHAVGADVHPRGDPGGQVLHVVEADRRVGQDHPLGAGVGDVALVPEGDVLEPGLGVAAQDPGEAGDPLGADRVALVRHRRGALLAGAERLLDLAHLGALQVADLGREALEPGAGDRDPRGAARRGGRAGTTWVATSSRRSPRRSITRASTAGGTEA